MSERLVDGAARLRALDPRESFIVQAPAGSGKTELLTQRYLRLLATVEAPEQIVAITFTRKAAAEMRQRILHALNAAKLPPPDSAHKRMTWDLARAVRELDQENGWQLEQQPSRLRIQTIDAFSASLARRLPVIAGTGSAVEPTDDATELYEAASLQLLSQLGDGSAVAIKLEDLIVHLGNRVDRLIELLCALLAKRDQWLHPIMRARSSDDLRAALEGTLRRVVERHLGELCDMLGTARLHDFLELAQYAAGNLLANDSLTTERREQLEACLRTSPPLEPNSACLAAWRALATMAFKQDGELYSTVTKVHGFPTTNREAKERMLRLLRELTLEPQTCEALADLKLLPDPRYSDAQWHILEALLEVLPAAVVQLQFVFQARTQADYVEVSLRALQALGTSDEPTDLALAFDYRLQHLLVDEFQDTSFAQQDLLERLTAGWQPGDGRTLFCVGDPMQSIYRFRQAEVGLFIQLQHRGLENVHLTPLRLEANFRSEPAIVAWVNQVFPEVLAKRSDAEQGAVEYSASIASRHGEGTIHVHPLINADRNSEALQVVDVVRGSIEADRDGTIAVLVSTRTRVDAIARELTRANIEFQAVEIERLYERPVVQDLIALTRALVHVGDRTAWLSVLRAPWCGIALPDLHAIATHSSLTIDEALSAAAQREVPNLSQNAQLRIERAYSVLSKALAERGRWDLRTWVERAWNALAGPATAARAQDLEDAEAFFSRLETLEEAGDLADITRLEQQLERLFARPRILEKSSVELMTIHAAKGLEFDTVILPGLDSAMRNEDRELLRWTRIAGDGGGIVLAPVKAEGSDADPIYRWIESLERRRITLERGRLLYVAVTRAKKNLHLIGNVPAKDRDGAMQPADPRKGSMLKMLWPALAGHFEAAAPKAEMPSFTRVEPRPQQIRRLPLDWSQPASAPPILSRTTPVVDVETERPIFDWVTQTGRQIGTLVHRELDRTLRHDRSIGTHDRARLETELSELGVPPGRIVEATTRVVSAIERMRTEPRARWLLGLTHEIAEVQSELALTAVINGEIVQGVIDRTFVDAAGTRWIVDFKTSTHEGGGLDAFLDEEVIRYTPQLTRYAQLMRQWQPEKPVRVALYFPLLGAWREVKAQEAPRSVGSQLALFD
jgi:ATP-dependent exoDNAse (exonuclease V) beta subunit